MRPGGAISQAPAVKNPISGISISNPRVDSMGGPRARLPGGSLCLSKVSIHALGDNTLPTGRGESPALVYITIAQA